MDPNKKEIQFTPNPSSKPERKSNRASRHAFPKNEENENENGSPTYGCLKNGKIPTIALSTTGSAYPMVLLMNVYCDALSMYLENDIQVSMQPKPRKNSAVVMLFSLLTI